MAKYIQLLHFLFITGVVFTMMTILNLKMVQDAQSTQTSRVESDRPHNEAIPLDYFLHIRERAIILDSRPVALFKLGHIPNAVSSADIDTILHKNDDQKSKTLIVVYGEDETSPSARRIFSKLRKDAWNQTYLYPGGFKEWIVLRLPINQ